MTLSLLAAVALIWSIGGFIAAIRTNGRYLALFYGPLYWAFAILWYWSNRERHD